MRVELRWVPMLLARRAVAACDILAALALTIDEVLWQAARHGARLLSSHAQPHGVRAAISRTACATQRAQEDPTEKDNIKTSLVRWVCLLCPRSARRDSARRLQSM